MRRIPPGAPIVTAAQMRAAEQACFETGVSQDEVMERAGCAVAREVRRLSAGQPVLVLAGPGNNGGDAYVVARFLAGWGHDVTVAALGSPKTGSAARMAAQWRGPTSSLHSAEPKPVLVDGLLGTGSPRPFDPETQAAIDALHSAASLVIAIDLPSGADADSGTEGGLTADITVALAALKPVHLIGRGAGRCGHLLLADIGVPVTTRWHSLADPVFACPPVDSHKYSRGMVVVLSGAMPGAARLAARAALAGGAGYVVLAGRDLPPGPCDAIVHADVPTPDALSALLQDERIGALVIGPGLGQGEGARRMLDIALASARDLTLDGDALTLLGTAIGDRTAKRPGTIYLTPHSGEFDRMFGTGTGSKIARTADAAHATGTIIVHKGPDTVIADPAGSVTVAAGATPWLSTAGTGDVLAGLLAARHAAASGRGSQTANEAVWLHTRAAARAGPSFCADDLASHIGGALASAAWE